MFKLFPRYFKLVPKPADVPASELAKAQPIYIDGLPSGEGAVTPEDVSQAATTAEWAKVSGKPTTFAPITGTAANQAAPGNHNHPVTADAASGLAAAASVQALAVALSARIKALEDAPA